MALMAQSWSWDCQVEVKVRLLPSKSCIFIYFSESPLKMMKNAFNFMLKAVFVLKVFAFMS